MADSNPDARLAAFAASIKARMDAEGISYEVDHSVEAEKGRTSHVGRVSVRGVPSATGTILGLNLRTIGALGIFGAFSWWFFTYDPLKGMDLTYREPKLPKFGKSDEDPSDEKKEKPRARSTTRGRDFIPSPPFKMGSEEDDLSEDEDFEEDDALDDEDEDAEEDE